MAQTPYWVLIPPSIRRKLGQGLLGCCFVAASSCAKTSTKTALQPPPLVVSPVAELAQGHGTWEISHPFADPRAQNTNASCGAPDDCLLDIGGAAVELYDGHTLRQLANAPAGIDVSFCVGRDRCVSFGLNGKTGTTWVYAAGKWSEKGGLPLAQLQGPPSGRATPALQGLDCASLSFCMAATNYGKDSTYSDGLWSSPTQIDSVGVEWLSCVHNTTTCFLIDGRDGYEETVNGKVRATGILAGLRNPSSISCATVSLCAVGDEDGNVYRYDGTGWHDDRPFGQALPFFGGQQVRSVSCAASAFCMASVDGTVSIFDGTSCDKPVQVDPHARPVDLELSCSTATFCLALGGAGSVFAVWRAK